MGSLRAFSALIHSNVVLLFIVVFTSVMFTSALIDPHVGPNALLHCIRLAVALFVIFEMWLLRFTLLSSVFRRNLTEFVSSVSISPTLIGLGPRGFPCTPCTK